MRLGTLAGLEWAAEAAESLVTLAGFVRGRL